MQWSIIHACLNAHFLGYLDMLPYIRFWIYYTHVRLVCTAVNQGAVIQLQERIACVVLSIRKD